MKALAACRKNGETCWRKTAFRHRRNEGYWLADRQAIAVADRIMFDPLPHKRTHAVATAADHDSAPAALGDQRRAPAMCAASFIDVAAPSQKFEPACSPPSLHLAFRTELAGPPYRNSTPLLGTDFSDSRGLMQAFHAKAALWESRFIPLSWGGLWCSAEFLPESQQLCQNPRDNYSEGRPARRCELAIARAKAAVVSSYSSGRS